MIDYTLPLNQLPDPLPIMPLAQPFDVTIAPPGSKSITNRAYVLAALAEGESRIIRPLRSDDTDGLLDALCTLGAKAQWDGDDVRITGVNGRFPRGGSVNLGDGGTPTRFMIAAACLAAEPVVVDGSKRMRERPIAEGVDMLRQLGATIEYMEEEGRLPVRIVPSDNFKGGELTVGKTASSQFISAVMLIGPWLERGLQLQFTSGITSAIYVFLTWQVIRKWHAEIREVWPEPFNEDPRAIYDVWPPPQPRELQIAAKTLGPMVFAVEPDASSALYWVVAADVVRNSQLVMPYYRGLYRQADSHAIFALGAAHDDGSELRHPRGFQTFRGRTVRASFTLDASSCPDGSLGLAVAAAVADGTSTITGLHTLRVKETDRIAALANELRKVGCTVETTDDSIAVTPPAEPGANSAVVIETYNDHRMAMSFAILGLVRPGISIANPKCVAKSYPTFWRDFAKLYEHPAGPR